MDATQLAQVESLCQTLYNSSDEAARSHAQNQLLSLQASAERIPQCQYILDHSENAYALLLASSSLTRLISNHWNSFTPPQRVEIRNYILNYLGSVGPNLTDYVKTSLIQLLCRITKLGWFDDPQHREVVDAVMRFLQATNGHYVIGLKILNQLVEEINIPISGRTLPQHRKTAVSFRDLCLLPIFQIALKSMQQIQMRQIIGASPEQENAMLEQALSLCTRCLSYDFIGTNPDESSEDVGTIQQVPSSWREVVTDPSTFSSLFEFYKNTEPPRSNQAMQSIVLLSSVRRSLFPKETDRAAYLQQLMNFIREILQTNTGLHHQDNYHQFCRQLGRLKANYQLSELVRVDGYIEWVGLAADFTVRSLKEWQWSTNSIHYLLALWGRLVAAVPYVRPDVGSKSHTETLQDCVVRVVQAYITSMVGSVDVVARDQSLDDPLDDEGSLKEQLERLPVICRFQYTAVAEYVLNIIDPVLANYQSAVGVYPPQANGSAHGQQAVLEGKLTWLVYMIGAMVGGYSWSDASASDGEETIDASLARRVFQLAQGLDARLARSGGRLKCESRLEIALLYFFQVFRRMYMWEQHGMSAAAALTGIMMGSGIPKQDYAPTLKQKVFARFFEHIGMGDHSAIINVIVTKIGNNLKYWPDDNEVVSKTLQLFLDMASGYSSSKMLLGLDTVKFLMHNHTQEFFPFLGASANVRQRTTFHLTLARLIFATSDDMSPMFEAFMEPLINVLRNLGAAPTFRQESVKYALVGVCRDLRGVTAATNNRRSYGMLFDALYPIHFGVFVRAAEEWSDSPDVTTSLMKFMIEFVYNKAQRLVFDQNSPNGILLFRECSKIAVAFGTRLLQLPPPQSSNIYREKYKGIALCLGMLSTALAGTYVNFGVFTLYQDKALDSALETALQLALSVPLVDVNAFPKLCKAYFIFFEILFRNHIGAVVALDTPVFMRVMHSLHDGLQALDAPLASQCAATIDHLATFHFKNANKDSPAMLALKAHLALEPALLSGLMETLFNILLFESMSNNTANQWAVTRPILSLLLADEQAFNTYKNKLIESQSVANRPQLQEAFAKLLADVHRNLESTNRDKFTQRLTSFRISVRQFLTM
ncbi:unnamed protein product [Ascophyllum nodosum]